MELLIIWLLFGILAFGLLNAYLRTEYVVVYDEDKFHFSVLALGLTGGPIFVLLIPLFFLVGTYKYYGLNFRLKAEPPEKIAEGWKKLGYDN